MSLSGSKRSSILFHAAAVVMILLMIYPILWMVWSSFGESSRVISGALFAMPERWSFDNYFIGWKGFGGQTFYVFFKNSLLVTAATVIGQVVSSAVSAYGFARIHFRGVRFWFICMIVTLMLPPQVLAIPQYIVFSKLGWINSFKPLIVPAFFGYPFFIFLIMQFMQGIPKELDESAQIDGCNKFSIFYKIIVPLIMPAIVTSVIFSFYWSWQDFFAPLLYIQSPDKYTISIALRLFTDPSTVTNWGAVFAMSVLSLLPVFVLFVFSQKYIVEGISTSGMKG